MTLAWRWFEEAIGKRPGVGILQEEDGGRRNRSQCVLFDNYRRPPAIAGQRVVSLACGQPGTIIERQQVREFDCPQLSSSEFGHGGERAF
jgi:hypothetical protein